MPSDPKSRRRFFRLRYPPADRPRLVMLGGVWMINELSEGGARLESRAKQDPRVGAFVSATIFFADGRQAVTGNMMRRTDTEWVVRFTTGVSSRRMLDEQRRVLAQAEQQRAYFMHYPPPLRPKFQMTRETCDVVELWQDGARLACAKETSELDPTVSGTLVFASGATVTVEADVGRRVGTEWLVQFRTALPDVLLMDEHARLFGALPERRRHFRLRYPFQDRPELIAGGAKWFVTELSEGGARLLIGDVSCPTTLIDGELVFPDGASHQVAGEVLRRTEDECVVRFFQGVPHRRMLDEQRRLHARYPRDSSRG